MRQLSVSDDIRLRTEGPAFSRHIEDQANRSTDTPIVLTYDRAIVTMAARNLLDRTP